MSETPRADFWFSIFLTGAGVLVVFESWRMPRLENLGIDPLSAPGLTPGLLGVVLTGLGIALFIRTVGQSAKGEATPPSGRVILTLALCLAYALGLLGRVDFWFATALFIFSFVLAFSDRDRDRSRVARLIAAVLLAVATATTVQFLFEQIFLVRLP